MFRHHIIPKHAGGSDDPSNIKVVGSFAEHAEEHRLLWEQYGRPEDKLAWLALSAQIGKEEIVKEKLKFAGIKGSIAAKTEEFLGRARERMIRMNKAKVWTSEDREKMSILLSGNNNPMFGKSGTFTGKSHSQVHRDYMRQRMRGNNNPNSKQNREKRERCKLSE